MDESDYNEITRVVFTRLSDQLRRVAEDLGQPPPSRSETAPFRAPTPDERHELDERVFRQPTDERRARYRNELIAKLGGKRG